MWRSLAAKKIDIVEYDEDPAKFIAAALSPATVLSVTVAEDGSHSCRVTVPDSQLSLAIGNRGQNVRLAAKLTGWKIDIKPESGFFGEEPAAQEPAAARPGKKRRLCRRSRRLNHRWNNRRSKSPDGAAVPPYGGRWLLLCVLRKYPCVCVRDAEK